MISKFKQSLWIILPIVFILMVFSTTINLNQSNYGSTINPDSTVKGFESPPSYDTANIPNRTIKNFESPPSASELDGKEVSKVGIYVLRIYNFDTTTGTYEVEFFLNFECQTLPCDPSGFEIPNATSFAEIEDQTHPAEHGKVYYYRVRTTLQTTIDVSHFPFDIQKLRLDLEDQNKIINEYIYIPDPGLSDIDSQVNIAGWSTARMINGREESHYYYTYDETYSRAIFELLIYNPVWDSILKTILPVIVITFAGIVSFFMRYDRAGDRLGVVSSSLVSAVLFSLSFPKGATFMSAYMLANYLLLVSALAVTVRLMSLVNENKLDEARKLHDLTDNIYPVLWLIAQVIFIAYGLMVFSSQIT